MDSTIKQQIAIELSSVVKSINAAWQEERFEDLYTYFHKDMVIASPDFEGGGQGIEACVESYRQFAKAAEIHEYNESDFNAVVWENTALVHYLFDMSYSLQGEKYRDTGYDLFIFSKSGDSWKAVWRTIIPKSIPA